jgi:small-conductance mechanosensitive channel
MAQPDHIRTSIHYVSGGQMDAGLDALADALFLIATDPTLLTASQIAHRIADRTLQIQARQREIEQQAAKLRAQLQALEQQLDDVA